jgi:FKBP-type peptidyl-prolyl cis-trans isomerase FkpA
MRGPHVPLILAALVCPGLAAAADPPPKPAGSAAALPKTEEDKTFYALGLFLASRGQLASFKLTPAELAMVQAGVADGASGHAAKIDLQSYLPKVQAVATERVAATQSALAVAEKKKGKEFLDAVASKEGVRKTGTGLLIETIADGSGSTPSPTDTVKVNYRGTTIDGKEFDASEKRGGPATFNLDGSLIACWKEAFQFIKPGGKAKIYCPSDIAYGDAGRGADIPPGATLVFEVELVEIVKPTP